MNWRPLSSSSQIDQIVQRSHQRTCLIFKHSTRCSLSAIARYRLEDGWNFSEDQFEPYFLDLVSHRNLAEQIAELFSVHHESPQLLLIKNGECIYDKSHLDISIEELMEFVEVPDKV